MKPAKPSNASRVTFLGRALLFCGLLAALAGCKMYGDTADDLGVHSAQIRDVGLVGVWASANDTLVIGGSGAFDERSCGTHGTIEYTSRYDGCASGTCGSSTFRVQSGAGYYGCRPVGDDICTFALTNEAQALTLSCSSGKQIYQRVN